MIGQAASPDMSGASPAVSPDTTAAVAAPPVEAGTVKCPHCGYDVPLPQHADEAEDAAMLEGAPSAEEVGAMQRFDASRVRRHEPIDHQATAQMAKGVRERMSQRYGGNRG